MASVELDADRIIVLSSTAHGDDSHIVRVFSRGLGVIPLWVRIGKSKRARGEWAKWHPMALLEVRSLSRKGSEGLFRALSVERALRLDAIPSDVRRSAVAFFLAEFLWRTFPEEAPHPDVVDWTWQWVEVLDQTNRPSNVHVRYLAGLTKLLGIAPEVGPSALDHALELSTGEYVGLSQGDEMHLSPQATRTYWQLVQGVQVPIPAAEQRELVRGMVRYIQLHLSGERPLKSLEVLEAIFQ